MLLDDPHHLVILLSDLAHALLFLLEDLILLSDLQLELLYSFLEFLWVTRLQHEDLVFHLLDDFHAVLQARV